MIEEDLEERDQFLSALESRFLFLAADARSTIRFIPNLYKAESMCISGILS